MPATGAAPRCPACNTPLVRGRDTCVSCGMTRVKMAEYSRAKALAAQRGVTVRVEAPAEAGRPWGERLRPLKVPAIVLLLIALLGGISYLGFAGMNRKPPTPWLDYPTDPEAAAKQYIAAASLDTVAGGRQAYKLLTMRERNLDDDAELARYRQVYHDMDKYFTETDGTSWQLRASYQNVTPSAAADPTIAVHVGTDVIHIDLEPQAPKDGPAPSPPHYGIVRIREFPIGEAAGAQKSAVVSGVLHGLGAGGSADQLRSITSVVGAHCNESPFAMKRRLLPILRRPNDPAIYRAVILTWPIRHDPTIRDELKEITEDQRYDPLVQKAAQRVLDDKVDLEELIGYGVPDVN